MTLVLGDVTFTGFELPESLPFGGTQELARHDLPGGVRVVDAMGAFEDDISWSGRFRGYTATQRARRLDTLRIQGRALLLTWDWFRRSVVIKHFRAEYQTAGLELPYHITCMVVENRDAQIRRTPPSVDDLIAQDINELMALGETLATMRQSIARLRTAYAAVQALKRGDASALGALIGNTASLAANALGPANSELKAALLATSKAAIAAIQVANAVAAAKNMAKAGDPFGAAGSVLNVAIATGQLGTLYQIQALAGRAMTNIGGARLAPSLEKGAAP